MRCPAKRRRVGMADDADSKSVGGNTVWVQVPPPAPRRNGLRSIQKAQPFGWAFLIPLRHSSFSPQNFAVQTFVGTPPYGPRRGAGINFITQTHMNEPHFSNCFIEKRGSSYVESLVTRGFPLFVAPDLFFKISQMQKQYFYIGLKFRQCFPIKQACEHLQMPVMSYHSAFGEAALHYRTEYAPLRFCRNVVQRYSPSGRLPLS